MAQIIGHTISFSAADETGHIRLGRGKYSVILSCGGSTVRLEGKNYSQGDSAFKTITLQDGSLNTSVDSAFAISGGIDVRLFVEAYVGAGEADFNIIESSP